MKIDFKWEIISYFEGFSETKRAKVIGGWIVKCEDYDTEVGTYAQSQSMIFIADPSHEWEVIEHDEYNRPRP